jgi:Predicted ATPase
MATECVHGIMARHTGAFLHFCNGNLQRFNKIFLLTGKSVSCFLRVSCNAHQHTLKTKSEEGAQKSLSQTCGPLAVLQERLGKGELMHDDFQYRITESLQHLYENIKGYTPPVHGLFSGWVKKVTKTPKGLYIYGAVGGGKTMLMDLFYNCCEVHFLILVLITSDIFCICLILHGMETLEFRKMY